MSARAAADLRALDGTFMSEEEYLDLPETMNRMELVDGLVVCEPSATEGHQALLLDLAITLHAWAGSRTPRPAVYASPLDVRFAPGRILQPDVFVYLEPLVRPVKMPIARIPDLCVEIVSRRVAYDRTTKRLLYAQAGVPELWTVLAERGVVERWHGAGLDAREECRERLVSPLLPDFALDVAALLSDR